MATSIRRDEHEKDVANAGKKEGTTTITVNNQPFVTEARKLTGLQVKAIASIPAEYELFIVRDGNSVPVANDEVINLKKDSEFRAIPAGTFGGGDDAPTATE